MVQLSYHPIKTELYRVQCFVNYIMLEVILKAHKSKKNSFLLIWLSLGIEL